VLRSPPLCSPTEGIDFASAAGRELAARRSTERIRESFEATLAVQQDPALTNSRAGFFLVYINSFNEWHEGHAFEPMQDASALPPGFTAPPYHNPARGDYRLKALAAALRPILDPADPSTDPATEPDGRARRSPYRSRPRSGYDSLT
jgi:hypothetical protein